MSSATFIYDANLQPGLVAVLGDSTGSRYVHAPRGIHAAEDQAENWQHVMTDALGSVRGMVSEQSDVVGLQSYSLYGVPDAPVGSVGTPFRFTGEMRDGNGVQYHRARYLSPALGGWLSLDPWKGDILHPQTLNGYDWVNGRVLSSTDSSGRIRSDLFEAYCVENAIWEKLLLQESSEVDLSAWIPPVERPFYNGGNRYGRNECPNIDFLDCNAIRLATGTCRNPDGSPLAQDCQCYQSDGTDVPPRYVIHPGADFATNLTPILAVAGGILELIGYDEDGYGNYIILRHGNDLYTLYAHLTRVFPRRSLSKIYKGEQLGISGCTGRCTADHLHFEIKRELTNYRYPRSPEELEMRYVNPINIPGVSIEFAEEPEPWPVVYPSARNNRCPQECCSQYATY
jgi:RHS repeat-associated protein